jgi:two-component system, LytTR family, sensor kinase
MRPTAEEEQPVWTKIRIVLKRDELGLPSFWQLQAMGWVVFYLIVLVAGLPYHKPEEIGYQTIGCSAMFLSSCILHPLCRSLLRQSLPWLALEVRALAWAVFIGFIATFITEFVILHHFRQVWSDSDLPVNILQFSVVLFLWCTLYFSIKQWQQAALERDRLLRAETEARDAHLSALRYQLNPHFLFNSLNAVSTLVLKGETQGATRMISQIAGLLRVSLEGPILAEIPLSQELDFAKRYLAIEQTRLGDRLQVEFDIAPDSLDASIPGMLLQPLLENAVLHGVGRLRQGGIITIQTATEDNRLRIVVANSGPLHNTGAESEETRRGIGLTNTRERLRRVYGSACEFTLHWPDRGGCVLTIRMPCRKIAAPVEELSCVR